MTLSLILMKEIFGEKERKRVHIMIVRGIMRGSGPY